MNKFSIAIISAVLCLLCSCSARRPGSVIEAPEGMSRELKAAGENVRALSAKESVKIATSVARTYKNWDKLSMNGRLRMKGLPISPGVKVYMERGSLIVISLRAPLMGEVGRVELTRDSVLMVNKMSKKYCAEDIRPYLGRLGADITNVQDLLLGRVFLLNAGTLSEGNAALVDVSTGASDTWIFTPKGQDPRAEYGFTLFQDGKMLMAAAFTTDLQNCATAEYGYEGKDTQVDIMLKYGKKEARIALEFDAPDMKPNPIERVRINNKWEKVSIGEFIRSMR